MIEQIRLPVLMYKLIFGFYADFGFTAVYSNFGYIRDEQWVEMIWPKCWAGVTAQPP